MPTSRTRAKLSSYIQEPEIRHQLQLMYDDKSFLTVPGYSIDTETYPDNKVPFIESHIDYLKKHPQVNPEHYLSNLHLMLKKR